MLSSPWPSCECCNDRLDSIKGLLTKYFLLRKIQIYLLIRALTHSAAFAQNGNNTYDVFYTGIRLSYSLQLHGSHCTAHENLPIRARNYWRGQKDRNTFKGITQLNFLSCLPSCPSTRHPIFISNDKANNTVSIYSRAVQRGARGRHGARDILSWRPTLLCRL
jgi:hypothetical protein